jgi:hypothetical protein
MHDEEEIDKLVIVLELTCWANKDCNGCKLGCRFKAYMEDNKIILI